MNSSQPVVPTPMLKQLVLVGGGHSHLFVLMSLTMNPIPGLRVVLISKDSMTGYSGMLPGYIAGHYDFEETHIDLCRLAEYAGVTFLRDEVLSLDPRKQTVSCRKHGDISFDWCSLNTGSTPLRPPVGSEDGSSRAVAVKPINQFLEFIHRLERSVATSFGESPQPLNIAVVGAGAAGVEVVLALVERFTHVLGGLDSAKSPLRFHLLASDHNILALHNAKARAMLQRILEARGIDVHVCFRVVEHFDDNGQTLLVSADGQQLVFDEVVYATGAEAAGWLRETELALDEKGFVRVHPSLQTIHYSNIFAAGDVANIEGHPTEKAGVFAVRQGKPLAHNIRAAIEGRGMKSYVPQKKWLALLTTGDKYAVASRGQQALEGNWVWRWKDHIDRKFMAMFQDLPSMPIPKRPDLPAALREEENDALMANLGMRCAGCGSKVGSSVLQQALRTLQQPRCEGVDVGLDAPDDAAVIAVPEGLRLVQSVDYFTSIVSDPWLQGRIAAVHSLGDVHAMGASPHSALAMVSLPLGSQEVMSGILQQTLEGALSVFREEGLCIVGGHTTEASELSVGFSVNAFVAPDQVLHKQGLRAGDWLVLTKPLGTGVLFAGHSQWLAKGHWVDMALNSMGHSNGAAAAIMSHYDVSACTDVTGFGVAGHLVEMLQDTPVGVELDLAGLPLLPGAEELSSEGVKSTLFSENFKVRHRIENLSEFAADPRFELLFDPQTAGGLLAGVRPEEARLCLTQLRQAGYPAVVIGEVFERSVSDEDIPALLRLRRSQEG